MSTPYSVHTAKQTVNASVFIKSTRLAVARSLMAATTVRDQMDGCAS